MPKAQLIMTRKEAKAAIESYRDYLLGWDDGLTIARKTIEACRPIAFLGVQIESNFAALNVPSVSIDTAFRFSAAVEEITNSTLISAVSDMNGSIRQGLEDLAIAPVSVKTARTLPDINWKKGEDAVATGYREGVLNAKDQCIIVFNALNRVDLTEEYKTSSNPLRNGTVQIDPRGKLIQDFFSNLSHDVAVDTALHSIQLMKALSKGLSPDQISHEHNCWSNLVLFRYTDDLFKGHRAVRMLYSVIYDEVCQSDNRLHQRAERIGIDPSSMAGRNYGHVSLACH